MPWKNLANQWAAGGPRKPQVRLQHAFCTMWTAMVFTCNLELYLEGLPGYLILYWLAVALVPAYQPYTCLWLFPQTIRLTRPLTDCTPHHLMYCSEGRQKRKHGPSSASKKSEAEPGRKHRKSEGPSTESATTGGASSAAASVSVPQHKTVAYMCEEGVTFPEKLIDLLNSEADKQSLWWLPSGKQFAIESKRFRKTILARNFQGSKFESFTRKLGRW